MWDAGSGLELLERNAWFAAARDALSPFLA
jgi:hypothetical protein